MKTYKQFVTEVLGGKPGDGYIGNPKLNIKNPFAKKPVDVGTTADNTKPGVVKLKTMNDPELDKINRQAQQSTKRNYPNWWKEKGPSGTAWQGQQQFKRDLTK